MLLRLPLPGCCVQVQASGVPGGSGSGKYLANKAYHHLPPLVAYAPGVLRAHATQLSYPDYAKAMRELLKVGQAAALRSIGGIEHLPAHARVRARCKHARGALRRWPCQQTRQAKRQTGLPFWQPGAHHRQALTPPERV